LSNSVLDKSPCAQPMFIRGLPAQDSPGKGACVTFWANHDLAIDNNVFDTDRILVRLCVRGPVAYSIGIEKHHVCLHPRRQAAPV
jgi:hypothetical protein